MKNQRGFISVLLAIVLGLIVIGGGAYYVLHQQAASEPVSENGVALDTGATAQNNQNIAPATPALASSVFVTPNGTPILRPPQNWTSTVSSDGSSSLTTVVFVNPIDHNDKFGVAINARSSNYNVDSDLASISASVTKKGGQIINTNKTANGYIFEARLSSINQYAKFIRITTPTKVYFISESTTESDWSLYSPLFDQAVATLQIN